MGKRLTEHADESKPEKSLPEGLLYISKAWDPLWFLRVASVLLFADISLAQATGSSLLGWKSISLQALLNELGDLAMATMAFGLIMSLGLPFLSLLIQRLLLVLPSWALEVDREPSTTIQSARHSGKVTVNELRDYAHARESQFILNIVETHERRLQRDCENDRELAGLLFGFAALAIADLNWPVSHTQTIVGSVWSWGMWGVPFLLIWLLGTGSILKACWFPPSRHNWIHFQPLAGELESQERAAAKARGDEPTPAYLRRSSTPQASSSSCNTGESVDT
jgi:hypothetical protein